MNRNGPVSGCLRVFCMGWAGRGEWVVTYDFGRLSYDLAFLSYVLRVLSYGLRFLSYEQTFPPTLIKGKGHSIGKQSAAGGLPSGRQGRPILGNKGSGHFVRGYLMILRVSLTILQVYLTV